MLRIGKILKSNGTDGGLLVSAPEVELEQIEGPVYVEFDGLPAPFFFDDCVPRGTSRYIVHMTGVRCLKDAEEMVGRDILFDGEFEEEGSDEDFVGWKLFDRDVEVGVVEDYDEERGMYKVTQKNKLYEGDVLNVLMPEGYVDPIKVLRLEDDKGEHIESTPHPEMTFYMEIDNKDVRIPPVSFISRDGDKDNGIDKQVS